MTTHEERAARDKCLVRFMQSEGTSDGMAAIAFRAHVERQRERRRARRRHRIGVALEIAAGAFCAAFVLWCAWGLMVAFSR